MRKIITTMFLMGLAGTVAMASPRPSPNNWHSQEDRHDNGKHRGEDRNEGDDHHDNGKHKGWDKHHEDDGDHHDNGQHKGWYKHGDRDDYRGWDQEHDRIRPGRAYPYGRYEHVRDSYIIRAYNYRTRRVVLVDNSNWVVATYDADRCRDWQFERDNVFVYDDDHHPGWYLLFNARLGRSVHVEFSGVR